MRGWEPKSRLFWILVGNCTRELGERFQVPPPRRLSVSQTILLYLNSLSSSTRPVQTGRELRCVTSPGRQRIRRLSCFPRRPTCVTLKKYARETDIWQNNKITSLFRRKYEHSFSVRSSSFILVPSHAGPGVCSGCVCVCVCVCECVCVSVCVSV